MCKIPQASKGCILFERKHIAFRCIHTNSSAAEDLFKVYISDIGQEIAMSPYQRQASNHQNAGFQEETGSLPWL